MISNDLGLTPILVGGTQDQIREWLAPCSETFKIFAFCLSEPGAGSDVAGLQLHAEKDGNDYVLNGTKAWITNGGVADLYTVFATLDRSTRHADICAFVIPRDTPGLTPGKKEDKMGWRASDTRELLIEDAFVAEKDRLGEEGEGFVNFMKTLDAGRIGLAALSVGLAEGAFEAALRFVSENEKSGRKIGDGQGIQFQLADIATDIQAGRHLTYHAAWLKDHERPFTKEAAMAKLFCSELAMRATEAAVRIMGGAGYTADYPVERMMRDAKVCEIGEGTNEIQRLIIGRQLIQEMSALTAPG